MTPKKVDTVDPTVLLTEPEHAKDTATGEDKPAAKDEKKNQDTSENEPASKDEKINTEVANKEPNKPIIPGLPEEDRLKQPKKQKRKKKKKNQEKEDKDIASYTARDFLISPGSGMIMMDEFEFSGSDGEETSGDEDEFEDSREVFSDNDNPSTTSDFLTPVNLKSTFARNLQAKTTVKPVITPSASKRGASSPAATETKETKKSRAQTQSKLPKKK